MRVGVTATDGLLTSHLLAADTRQVGNTHDLRVLLASRHPLIYVAARDEERFLRILTRAANDVDAPVWTWSATQGLRRIGEHHQYGTADLRHALDFIAEVSAPGVFVLSDAAPALEGVVALRRLKEVAQAAGPGQTIIVTGTEAVIPDDVAAIGHAWTLRPPSREELTELATRTFADFHTRGFSIRITKGELRQLADSLSGMTIREAERIIQRAIVSDGRFDSSDLAAVRTAKAEILNQDGVLEVIEAKVGTMSDIGGLKELKGWLDLREPVFRGTTTDSVLDLPKGILLTGVPGCGKSLVAKTIASSWGVPLILLDPSRLYSKYVGESEARLNSALQTVEAMSPVVVWIDEIEKGFASGDSDGGVSSRILGTFLRWLQDRESKVFMVATANDVSALPPELLRRGRFDQIFFVDLPDADARRSILITHLNRRDQDASRIDVDRIVEATDGFSGAEIETVVVGALYRSAGARLTLDTTVLLAEIATTVPLAVSRREDIEGLRRWANERAHAA